MQKIIIQNIYPSIKFDSFCLFYGTFGICTHLEKFEKLFDGNLENKLVFMKIGKTAKVSMKIWKKIVGISLSWNCVYMKIGNVSKRHFLLFFEIFDKRAVTEFFFIFFQM